MAKRLLLKDKPVAKLSPLFRRFAADFPSADQPLLSWLAPHLPEDSQAFLKEHPDTEVDWLDEDWTLNAR